MYRYFLMVLYVRVVFISLVYLLWFFLYVLIRLIVLFRLSFDGFIFMWFINLKLYCVRILNFEENIVMWYIESYVYLFCRKKFICKKCYKISDEFKFYLEDLY